MLFSHFKTQRVLKRCFKSKSFAFCSFKKNVVFFENLRFFDNRRFFEKKREYIFYKVKNVKSLSSQKAKLFVQRTEGSLTTVGFLISEASLSKNHRFFDKRSLSKKTPFFLKELLQKNVHFLLCKKCQVCLQKKPKVFFWQSKALLLKCLRQPKGFERIERTSKKKNYVFFERTSLNFLDALRTKIGREFFKNLRFLIKRIHFWLCKKCQVSLRLFKKTPFFSSKKNQRFFLTKQIHFFTK